MKQISISQAIDNKESNFQLTLENKISYYHFAAFLVMLPFDRIYSQLVLISLLIHVLIHFSKQKLSSVLARQNIILSSVFLLTVVGTAWSADKKNGIEEIERQIAIILFPIIFSATGLAIHQHRRKLLHVFGITCIATVLFLYANAIHIIIYHELPLRSLLSPVFINHHFSEPLGIHATYLSMYVSLSVAIFLFFLVDAKNKSLRLLYSTATIILLAGLLQLASKSALIATVVFVYCGLFLFLKKRKRKYLLLVSSLFVSLIILFAITRIGTFQKRYVEGIKDDLTATVPYTDVSEPRIMRWRCALPLVKQSFLAGHGSGSEKRLLKEKFFDNKLYNSYLHELNAHNQYLSFLIKYGIIGLIVFLFTLFNGFSNCWRNNDFIFSSFLILVSIVSLSENILDVNKGIFFYAFFFSFFAFGGNSPDGVFRSGKQTSRQQLET